MGGTVIVIEPSRRIGGLTNGGIGRAEPKRNGIIGGIAREFYRDIHRHYLQSRF